MSGLKNVYVVILISLMLSSCKGDSLFAPLADSKENQWIYEKMTQWYLWVDKMPKYEATGYASMDPTSYFKDLLYMKGSRSGDRFSAIKENTDYVGAKAVEQETDFGAIFSFTLIQSSIGADMMVVARVMHVYPGSPAEKVLKRGDMIWKVNNTAISSSNFNSIFDQPSISAELCKVSNGQLITGIKTITLTKNSYTPNPILEKKIITTDSGKKVGYLAYSSFAKGSDDLITNAIGEFKNGGVTELVLDLRYNGGGLVSTAVHLASLLTPKDNLGTRYINMEANKNVTSKKLDQLHYDFTNNSTIRDNKLELNSMVVLTSFMTASASETTIHCMRPFLNVFVIGSTTVGKNQASIELGDPTHKYTLFPIFSIVSDKNRDTFSNEGIKADVVLEEKIANTLYPLGDQVNEPLLAAAIRYIENGGLSGKVVTKATAKSQPFYEKGLLAEPKNGGNIVMEQDFL